MCYEGRGGLWERDKPPLFRPPPTLTTTITAGVGHGLTFRRGQWWRRHFILLLVLLVLLVLVLVLLVLLLLRRPRHSRPAIHYDDDGGHELDAAALLARAVALPAARSWRSAPLVALAVRHDH